MISKDKPLQLRIATEGDVALSLMEAIKFARAIGFDHQDVQKVATAVSEIVRNVLKYAGAGGLQMSRMQNGRQTGVEVIVTDKGPGIEDVDKALTDHYTTGRSLGLGLPGVKRMMDDLEIESHLGQGTTVTFRKWQTR